MTKEEVKEIFDHNWTKLVNPDYSDDDLAEAQSWVIEALSAEPQEWISVKDRLPKENSTYRITLQTDDGYRYVAGDYFYTERNSFESEAYYKGVGRKIVAWQPITEPSPYKGE